MATAATEAPPPVEWPTDASHYELIGKIGQGAFASVWGARTKEAERRECAVKVLNLDHIDTNLSEIRQEVQSMRLSSHPNVLTCHTAFVKHTDLWLVTQIMRKGSSLHSLQTARRCYQEQNKPCKMENHILYIIRETLLGLKYIHDNGQIHRDIKAGNILLDGNGDVCIADFGVSGWLEQAGSQQDKAKTFVGTPCWMAPEVMEQIHGYDYKADIWSLGITALELAKNYAPYARLPPMKVLILTIQEDPPSLDSYDEEDGDEDLFPTVDEEYTSTFRNLVDTCLKKDPSKRPTCQDLLQSKYLNAMGDPAKREARRKAIKQQVCDLVADVGTDQQQAAATAAANAGQGSGRNLPGNTPISIVLSQEENRPPGTTWVFADGSQVVASSTNKAASVDDVMNEIDQFGLQTGGEHYDRSSAKQAADVPPQHQSSGGAAGNGDDDNDDLDNFMDEFEQTTAGENFKRD